MEISHGQFNLLNNKFYRLVLACYQNENLNKLIFNLIVTDSPVP